jgi:uncharacterized repeat protein (TIGR03803 family)
MTRSEKLRFVRPLARSLIAILTGIFMLTMLAAPAAQAQTFQVLYTFSGQRDGGYPDGGLTMDGSGTFYGSTFGGPPTQSNYGNVFQFRQHGPGWLFTTIYSFQGGNDGAWPRAPLVVGPDGALYGATTEGGGDGCGGNGTGCGTIYRVTPPPGPCRIALCAWDESVIHSFASGSDGANPEYVGLVFDNQGNLYGTAPYNNSSGGYGVVYKLTPQGGAWTYNVLYTFTGGSDGEYPQSGVTLDTSGNLYGTTPNNYFGEVYQLTPSRSGWTKNTLYNFQGGTDGSSPVGGLIFDSHGDLYGSTTQDGTGGGTVFQLTPQQDGTWAETLRQDLPGGHYGPFSSLTTDAAGNLYGTTDEGGAYGYGSVFKLTYSGGNWVYTTLHDFTGGSDGAYPSGGVTLDASGNLYGTTANGGSQHSYEGFGVIWEITP